MPYNFEGTFTQPLLLKLDNGTITGASDWADAITTGYIDTIKAGLPQNTPPTLPAPGLNPTSPPPFAIGASGFSTADTRSKLMYNVVYAYFYAKELSLDKAAIKSLTATVKQLLAKIKNGAQKIKSIITKIKFITEQLKQLPKIIVDVIAGIKDEIKHRIDDLKDVFGLIDNARVSFGAEQFQSLFAREMDIINKIKNFNPLDVSGLAAIVSFVTSFGKNTNNQSGSQADQLKNYIQGRLVSVAKVFIELVKGVADPTKIFVFVKQLATDNDRIKSLFEKVSLFDNIVRVLQPQLRSLEAKKKALIKQARDYLQEKLIALQKKLNDKISEYAQKLKTSKALGLYKKASGVINDFKKKNQVKIKKAKTNITVLTKALKKSNDIVKAVVALTKDLEIEFSSIKQDIVNQQKSLSIPRITFNPTIDTNALTRLPNVATGVQSITALAKKQESNKLHPYFVSLGLGAFSSLGTKVMEDTQCDLDTFKSFFEKRSSSVTQYVTNIQTILNNLSEVITLVQSIKGGPTNNVKKLQHWLTSRVVTLKDLLHTIVVKLEPKVKKIKDWIRAKINEVKKLIETHLKKFAENLKVFAINLLPLNSTVQDVIDKKAELEAKVKKIKDKIAQLKQLAELGIAVSKMAFGGIALGTNIAKGDFAFSKNQTPINKLLDGYYAIKAFKQTGGVKTQLVAEKEKFKEHFKTLIVIESLLVGFVESMSDIKNSDFLSDLKNTVNNLGSNAPGIGTLKALVALFENPPKSPLAIKTAIEQFSFGVLNDVNVLNVLVNLERKYLSKSRAVIQTLCDIKSPVGSKYEKKLLKIKTALDKKQSFLANLFQMLLSEIKSFAIFIAKKLSVVVDYVKKKIEVVKVKIQVEADKLVDKIKEKLVNVEAPIMSFTFELAARLFWTGATWQGSSGTTHITFNTGPFTPIKAKSTDGASALVKEIARGFESQLQTLQGILIPPPNTLIPPIPFTGYK